MKRIKKISALLFAMLFVFGMSTTVIAQQEQEYAHPVPEENENGSIEVVMKKSDGTAVGGGSLTIYQVGKVETEDGNYYFKIVEEFKGSNVDLSNVDLSNKTTDAALAKKLAEYAKKQKLSGKEKKTINTNGKVTFSNLKMGLYLLVQNEAASGYDKVNPFLVSLPHLNEKTGKYEYAVSASPKVGPVTPTTATSSTKPDPKDPPLQSKLPQTGQLNWPIPLLSVSGISLFTVGWVLYFGKRKQNEE